MAQGKKILICPLDWGLGHATRCIPIIRCLLELGATVLVGGTPAINLLLKNEFPHLQFFNLKGYDVQYSKSAVLLPFMMLKQMPRLLSIIKYEHKWLQNMIETYGIHAVISDNRYGLYSSGIPSIFITHQIQIAIPQSAWIEKIINQLNHKFIRRFSNLWIPEDEQNPLAGKLASPIGHLPKFYFLGNLSRFEYQAPTDFQYEILFLLSGPEPQRSLLEKLIVAQTMSMPFRMLMVRGKPGDNFPISANPLMKIEHHLNARELQTAISKSRCIICRSGYSTMMDLTKLRRHAILIPTPGQTEQEYLAEYLSSKKWFIAAQQEKLDIPLLFKVFKKMDFEKIPYYDNSKCKKVIEDWYAQL